MTLLHYITCLCWEGHERAAKQWDALLSRPCWSIKVQESLRTKMDSKSISGSVFILKFWLEWTDVYNKRTEVGNVQWELHSRVPGYTIGFELKFVTRIPKELTCQFWHRYRGDWLWLIATDWLTDTPATDGLSLTKPTYQSWEQSWWRRQQMSSPKKPQSIRCIMTRAKKRRQNCEAPKLIYLWF